MLKLKPETTKHKFKNIKFLICIFFMIAPQFNTTISIQVSLGNKVAVANNRLIDKVAAFRKYDEQVSKTI
jgi:hypothetical protein